MDIEHELLPELYGEFDVYRKLIENQLKVIIINQDEKVMIKGAHGDVKLAEHVLGKLVQILNKGEALTTSTVEYAIKSTLGANRAPLSGSGVSTEYICTTPHGKYIRPKTEGQKNYSLMIKKKMIVLGVGPAGTGKTYLAMAHAITAFKKREVNRIILTRPALEAGEKLGFLPGDLQSKVDPYLRPLYDALYEIMGADSCMANMEKGLIEVAPLAYMRGRTLDNSFIVLDEAQNTTPAQMKMFLTRIGYGSKAVITGDITQKDLPNGTKSGMEVAMTVLKDISDIAICQLTVKDIVRHPLVQRIVEAYNQYENSEANKTKK
jgi:phosphate starvation-inducible PhoH-like protein